MRQWLSLRICPGTSKEKKKENVMGNPQYKTTKEYVRRMRYESRKNTPTFLEVVTHVINKEELMKQVDAKMKDS